jgi:hypothetical protein
MFGITKRMEELRMTDEMVAERSGVDAKVVSRMRWGGKSTPEQRLAVATVLKAPVRELFEEEGI